MTTYIWVIVGVLVVDVVGKTIILYRQDTHRSLGACVGDLLIGFGLLAWGLTFVM